jgi:hypothetical protein
MERSGTPKPKQNLNPFQSCKRLQKYNLYHVCAVIRRMVRKEDLCLLYFFLFPFVLNRCYYIVSNVGVGLQFVIQSLHP